LDEISNGSEKIEFGEESIGARAYLKRFLFSDDRINERVDLLSGGERARLMLAKVLKTGGNLIVLDEPTNDLDLQSLRILEEALANFSGTVLCVSHDRYFLDRICDQIIAFEDDGVKITPGNYSYYLEKRQARENAERVQAAAANKEAAARKKATQQKAKPRKLTMAEGIELQGMEEKIMVTEEKLAAAEAYVAEVQADYEALPGATTDVEKAQKAVAKLYARWEALEALPKG
ncbi:ATP-binding cassette domain-containing protein, partial [Akkermansiaceae bacterium]|nr:ATP-binding cassette domain-containing protein [Akkermansiaceae bacterium]